MPYKKRILNRFFYQIASSWRQLIGNAESSLPKKKAEKEANTNSEDCHRESEASHRSSSVRCAEEPVWRSSAVRRRVWRLWRHLQRVTANLRDLGKQKLIIMFIVFFLNGPTLASLFVYFHLFKQILQFYNKNIWKFPNCIQCRYSNPRPSDHEFPPITLAPALIIFRVCRLYLFDKVKIFLLRAGALV